MFKELVGDLPSIEYAGASYEVDTSEKGTS